MDRRQQPLQGQGSQCAGSGEGWFRSQRILLSFRGRLSEGEWRLGAQYSHWQMRRTFPQGILSGTVSVFIQSTINPGYAQGSVITARIFGTRDRDGRIDRKEDRKEGKGDSTSWENELLSFQSEIRESQRAKKDKTMGDVYFYFNKKFFLPWGLAYLSIYISIENIILTVQSLFIFICTDF